jgi:Antitoxin VbhA
VGVTEIPGAVAAELARPRAENARLLRMLELSRRQAAPPGPAQAGLFDALQEAAERQHAVAAALASVRAEGLEPGAEDLALFAEVAAGRLSTDELRERVLSRYRR